MHKPESITLRSYFSRQHLSLLFFSSRRIFVDVNSRIRTFTCNEVVLNIPLPFEPLPFVSFYTFHFKELLFTSSEKFRQTLFYAYGWWFMGLFFLPNLQEKSTFCLLQSYLFSQINKTTFKQYQGDIFLFFNNIFNTPKQNKNKKIRR